MPLDTVVAAMPYPSMMLSLAKRARNPRTTEPESVATSDYVESNYDRRSYRTQTTEQETLSDILDMEALGATGSIITIVEVSVRIASSCLQYINAVKDAPDEIKRLQQGVKSTLDVLQWLQGTT